MSRKKLPIGIQTFAKIREEGYYYVDKTPFVAKLAEGGSYYFLSRPRRFGKSLFLDTLAEAFSGTKRLFAGLYLENNWDWDVQHPVVRLSFAAGVLKQPDQLENHIHDALEKNATALQLPLSPRTTDVHLRFDELITRAAETHGQRAVVLVDEYDKPILDNLANPEVALAMREGLRNLYSVIKGRDPDLRFVFLTGVSKFSKVSLFSGLNNLRDITLSRASATICGYTDEDVDTVFAPELEGLDREEIRRWYNGYRWDGPPVYNPFDLLLLFAERKFQPWWFETASPTFLVNWLAERNFVTPQLERMFASEDLLSAFDVDLIRPEALLWQTGYLSIQEIHHTPSGLMYYLGVPNHEVRTALGRALMLFWHPQAAEVLEQGLSLYSWLATGDAPALRDHFVRLFASIPHSWYDTSPMARYEGYYASVFYSHLASLGLAITAEDVSSEGRCDLAVRFGSRVYVFEFKVVDGDAPTGAALAQLKAKDYAAKYRAPGVHVLEIGVEFSKTKRQIVGWEVGG